MDGCPATRHRQDLSAQTHVADREGNGHRHSASREHADVGDRTATALELNSIGVVEVETTRPLFLDTYAAQRKTGSFILIDAVSHATVAAGMVREILSAGDSDKHRSAVAAIAIRDPKLLRLVENALWDAGVAVVRTRAAKQDLLQRLLQAGVVVLTEAGAEASEAVSLALPAPGPRSPSSRSLGCHLSPRRRWPSF